MPDILSNIVAALESAGGRLAGSQPPSMVNPTYGQYGGFVNQYGNGPAGIDNFAGQILKSHPNATLGDFYATYVLGTGNPSHLYSPSDLEFSTVPGAAGAYNNLVQNAGYPLSTPLAQLLGTSGGSGTLMSPSITPAADVASDATQGGISSGPGDFFSGIETWLTNVGGSFVFVTIGVVLVLGALWIFAAAEGHDVPAALARMAPEVAA